MSAIDSGSTRTAAEALAGALSELRGLLSNSLSDADYVRLQPPIFLASVGQHVRHVLDHARALVVGLPEGRLRYDERERGGEIETRRGLAITELAALEAAALALSEADGATPLIVEQIADPRQAPVHCSSTLERELIFVMHHGVHHHAMIAAILRGAGLAPPAEFGVAPATLASRQP